MAPVGGGGTKEQWGHRAVRHRRKRGTTRLAAAQRWEAGAEAGVDLITNMIPLKETKILEQRKLIWEKRRIVWGEEKELMMALDWCESLADGEPIPRECTFE